MAQPCVGEWRHARCCGARDWIILIRLSQQSTITDQRSVINISYAHSEIDVNSTVTVEMIRESGPMADRNII